MAIHDAIAAAASDWDAVEPYLTPANLSAIATTIVDDQDLDALEERLLQILSGVVPARHEMWFALRSDIFRRKPLTFGDDLTWDKDFRAPTQFIGARVFGALTSEDLAKDAVADAIVESTKRRILGFGYRLIPVGQRDIAPSGALGITLENGIAYPAFQFADDDLTDVHPGFVTWTEFLRAHDDPLGALSWWTAPNAWLGVAPSTLLGTSRESEIAYAADQLTSDSW